VISHLSFEANELCQVALNPSESVWFLTNVATGEQRKVYRISDSKSMAAVVIVSKPSWVFVG